MVLEYKAYRPIAVLFIPDVFENNALSPIATRLVPVLELDKAFAPTVVLDGKLPAP